MNVVRALHKSPVRPGPGHPRRALCSSREGFRPGRRSVRGGRGRRCGTGGLLYCIPPAVGKPDQITFFTPLFHPPAPESIFPGTPAYGVSLQLATTTWQWFVATSSRIRQRRRIRIGSAFISRPSMTMRFYSQRLFGVTSILKQNIIGYI